jgi:hypothetical protein
MAAQLYSGIKSLHLQLDTPYDLIRTDDIRDDLSAVKVWISETSGFIPGGSDSTLVFDGLSLSITISDLEVNKQYYLKYAFISKIDPNTYTVSAQLSQTVYDENVRIYGYLTNSPTSIATDADGNGGNFSTATGRFKVFDLGQDVTGAGPVYSIKSGSNNGILGVSINSTTGVYACTGISSATNSVTFLATYNNIVVEQVWNVFKGVAGKTAPVIQLSATNNSFVFKDEFATTPLTAQTTLTATLKNVIGTPTFTTKAYTRSGVELGTGNTQIQFTQDGNSIGISGAQFAAPGVSLGTVIVTATIGEVSDSYTLYRINDGTNQITVELGNSSHVIPAANDGSTVPDNYIGSGTIIKVKQGNTYLEVDPSSPYNTLGTWRVTSIDSVNITCDTTPTIGSDYVNYDTHASMTADRAYIDYTISYITTTGGTGTATVRQSFAKSKEGAKAVSVILSNETHVFPANADGSVSNYANSGTEIRVYEGAGLLNYDGIGTANGTWSVTTSATSISVGNIADSGTYATVAAHSGVAAGTDTATITYTITGKSTQGVAFTLVKTQTFSKSKTGASPPKYATVYLYKWATTTSNPTGTSTYTWSNSTNSSYTAADGWSTSAPENPGTPLIKLWIATKSISAASTDTSTTVAWSVDTSVSALSQNGAFGTNGTNGVNGTNAATVRVYKTGVSIPAAPTGTSTYTWSSASFAAPADWTLNPPTSTSGLTGQTLWSAVVTLVNSATSSTSTINWSTAAIVAVSYYGTNGATGAQGVSARVAYAVTTTTPASSPGNLTVSGDNLPSAGTWFSGVSWVANAPASLSQGQFLYQVDGLYNPATNTTNWIGIPYISALKVGSLSAISTNTGNLTVTDTITVSGNSNTGVLIDTNGIRAVNGGITTFSISASTSELNGGNYSNYNWPASGGGYHLGPQGLKIGSYNANKYFNVTADGNVYTPKFNIVDGVMAFTGTVVSTDSMYNEAVNIFKLARGASLPDYVRTYKGATSPRVTVNTWLPLQLDAAALNNNIGANDYDAFRTLLAAGTYFYELSVPVKCQGSDTNDACYTAIVSNPPGASPGSYQTVCGYVPEGAGKDQTLVYRCWQEYVPSDYAVISTAGVSVVGDWQTATIFGVGRFTLATPAYVSAAVKTTDGFPGIDVIGRTGYSTTILRIWRDGNA